MGQCSGMTPELASTAKTLCWSARHRAADPRSPATLTLATDQDRRQTSPLLRVPGRSVATPHLRTGHANGPGRIRVARACSTVHRMNLLDAAMTQPQPGSEQTDSADEAPPVQTSPSDLDQERRTSMAAERTWLAWWRTALGATAGALAVGRFAAKLLGVGPWPYILLGCGYARRSRSDSRSSAHNASASWRMRCEPAATHR
jgi:hypothetical protein